MSYAVCAASCVLIFTSPMGRFIAVAAGVDVVVAAAVVVLVVTTAVPAVGAIAKAAVLDVILILV